VFANRVLRGIFGPKRDEVTEDFRKLHNEEPHNLYSSPNIIRMITSRRMRWACLLINYKTKNYSFWLWDYFSVSYAWPAYFNLKLFVHSNASIANVC
jgi:hypothetical protein